MKTPTSRQIIALKNIGITDIPQTRMVAQAIIRQHTLSKSKRGKNGRAANREARKYIVTALDSCAIRFECPICGGDHAKADHATA